MILTNLELILASFNGESVTIIRHPINSNRYLLVYLATYYNIVILHHIMFHCYQEKGSIHSNYQNITYDIIWLTVDIKKGHITIYDIIMC